MSDREELKELQMSLSIWFLCGIILTVYGLVVFGSGIYGLYNPPDVVGAELHLDLVWGIVLLLVGLVFVIHQRPGRVKEIRAEEMEQ